MTLFRPLLLTLVAATPALAQSVCRPGPDDNEAKLLAFFAAPLAFSPGGNIAALDPGEVRLGFELTYIPEPDPSISRSQRCFADKTERTHLSPVLPRPRLALGLPGGWIVEATYLPPVTVADATPNLGSLAIARMVDFGGAALLLRAHATAGQVKGAITCPPEEVQQSNIARPCFGPRPSEDTYKPYMFGGEAAITFVTSPRLTGYAGAGYTSLRPRFQVGFQEGSGFYDNTKIEVDLNRIALFAGGLYRATPAIGLTAELYSVPEDVTTVRIGASYTWR